MTTPNARDFRLAKNEYVIRMMSNRNLGILGPASSESVPFKSRCRGAVINIRDIALTLDTVQKLRTTSGYQDNVPYTIPASTGPLGNGDEFEYCDFKTNQPWSAGVDGVYAEGSRIGLWTDGATDSCESNIALIMVREESGSVGLINQSLRYILDESIGGDFFGAVLMNRDVMVRGVTTATLDNSGTDQNDTYEVKINGSVLTPAVKGYGKIGLKHQYIGFSNCTLPKYDLLEVNHNGASTSPASVYATAILGSHGPLNEHVLQLGKLSNITVADTNFNVKSVIVEPSTVMGVVIHTKVTTTAVDVWKLRVNGADVSPSVTFRGKSGLAANTGQYIGAQPSLVKLLPGDRVELRAGGQSANAGIVHAALVVQV